MTNILILITKTESGGAQTSVLNLAKKLIDLGHKITVGYGEDGFLVEELGKCGIEAIKFKNLSRSHNPLKNLFFALELRRYANRRNFDAIHFNSTNTLFGAIGAKLTKNPPRTVFTFRGLSVLDKNYQINPLLKYIYKITFKLLLYFIDRQVYVSFENQSQAKKLNIAKNDVVIHNGLDGTTLNFYDKNSARKKLEAITGINLTDKFLVGSIGRLSYQKNYNFLIKNFSKIKINMPDAVGIIIGAGPKFEEAKMITDELNLTGDLFLVGDIKQAHQYLKAFDLFILPSRYEGLPIALIETLFAGVPALCTDINGNREVLDASGLFYELDNSDEFIDKIKEAGDKKKRDDLSALAGRRAEKFNIEETAKKYLEIFSS